MPKKAHGLTLVVQIPAYNEADTLPEVLNQIPRNFPGIGKVILQVIDDGSTDDTVEIALKNGADYVIKNGKNRGLSRTFMNGILHAIHLGADIVINTDADNQYPGNEIGRLIEPILNGKAEIVIGNRIPGSNEHFPFHKRILNVIGSAFVSWISGAKTPDAASGFRAYSRFACMRLQVFNEFSYTLETIIQANRERIPIAYLPIKTNPSLRPSRLHRGVIHFLYKQGGTIIRSIMLYRPVRMALLVGSPTFIIGILLIIRYLIYYFGGVTGSGRHFQSVFIGGTLILFGFLALAVGLLGEGVRTNQRMLQELLIRMRNNDLDRDSTTFDGLDILRNEKP